MGARLVSPFAALADLAAQALSAPGQAISPEDIRRLASAAITQAQQVSYPLGRLAGPLDSASAGERRE